MFRMFCSGFALIISALGMSVFSAPATACTDTTDAWDCIHDGGNSITSVSGVSFSGSSTFYYWYTGSIGCDDVRAVVDVMVNTDGSSDLAIKSFDASNSTDPGCANFTYHEFDWTGSHDGAGSPSSETDTIHAAYEVGTVVIQLVDTEICRDSVSMAFGNDGLGGSDLMVNDTFSGWAGSCNWIVNLTNSYISMH